MHKIKGKFIAMGVFLLAFIIVCYIYAYYDEVHKLVGRKAIEMVRANDPGRVYTEIYDRYFFKDRIEEGCAQQDYGAVDDNERSFRHYYNPDAVLSAERRKKGVKFFNWYYFWVTLGAKVKPPEGGYFDGALEWARDSAKTSDLNNWQEAINAYGYTYESKEEAILRLGHVIHLLADMAEPDHVMDSPHPGSGFKIPRYGYEKFIEDYRESLQLSGRKISRFKKFDDYFNELAYLSKIECQKKSLEPPLGLVFIPEAARLFDTIKFSSNLASELGKLVITEAPLLGTIDPDTDGPLYMDLARTLLTYASEFSAGLLMDYHDIVNQPPYVKHVDVKGGGGLYQGTYQDELGNTATKTIDVVSRNQKIYSTPFGSVDSLEITVEFGPDNEEINEESIELKITGGTKVVTPKPKKTGDRTWKFMFSPALDPKVSRKELHIEIYAEDIHRHYQRAGHFPLDSNPATPAAPESKPPYSWKFYEEGWDKNHKIEVIRGSDQGEADHYLVIDRIDWEEMRGELSTLTRWELEHRRSENFKIYAGPFNSWVDLYAFLCPILADRRGAGFVFDDIMVSVAKYYLERCNILTPGTVSEWENAWDKEEEIKTIDMAKSIAEDKSLPKPKEKAKPKKPEREPLEPPININDIPSILSKMGFCIEKTENCAQGKCWWVIICESDLADRFGFTKNREDTILNLNIRGEIVYEGHCWGEYKNGKVIIWIDWLDTKYRPRLRSLPPFVRIYEKD